MAIPSRKSLPLDNYLCRLFTCKPCSIINITHLLHHPAILNPSRPSASCKTTSLQERSKLSSLSTIINNELGKHLIPLPFGHVLHAASFESGICVPEVMWSADFIEGFYGLVVIEPGPKTFTRRRVPIIDKENGNAGNDLFQRENVRVSCC